MPATSDEAAIEQLMGQLAAAWNHGDVDAYAARYRPDGTFTNVNGALYVGHEEFKQRNAEILRGYLKGTTLTLTIRKLRFIRSDVAVADIDTQVAGVQAQPDAVRGGPNGPLHASSLMVLVKEGGSWWITAYHNVWRAEAG
jgi:uncharacterized protein (TIGR02246 family)